MFRLVLVFIFAISTISYGRNINFPPSSLGGRIVGGENTTIEDYPYQISLQLQGGHWCGGSLIRPNVVLTAAHCMDFLPVYYSVRAGTTIKEEGGQVAQVSDVCNHPKYDGRDYDVSVLKLDQDFQLNAAVQLITLQNVGDEVPKGTMAVVTGWGALEWQGIYPKILQKVEVPKVDQIECQEKNFPSTISDRMTCYGYTEGEKDACQGDSGGPLVANGKQVGVVSFGYKCAWPNKPGVYASLENEEIHDHINSCLLNLNLNISCNNLVN